MKKKARRYYVGYGSRKQTHNDNAKRREKSPPKNVARSQRTVKTSQWPKGTIDKGNVLTIE